MSVSNTWAQAPANDRVVNLVEIQVGVSVVRRTDADATFTDSDGSVWTRWGLTFEEPEMGENLIGGFEVEMQFSESLFLLLATAPDPSPTEVRWYRAAQSELATFSVNNHVPNRGVLDDVVLDSDGITARCVGAGNIQRPAGSLFNRKDWPVVSAWDFNSEGEDPMFPVSYPGEYVDLPEVPA